MASTSLPVEQGDQVNFVADPDYEMRKLEVTEVGEEILLESEYYSVNLERQKFIQAVENSEKGKDKGFPKVWVKEE